MVNSLSPAFVQIQYHSAYAPHVMTLPTLEWTPDADYGLFATWGAGTIAADDMIESLILKMVPFFPSTVVFDSWTIYTMADVEAQAIPRAFKTNNEPGTNATPGQTKAVQATWTFKTSEGGISKVVMLDMGNNNSFERVTQATVGGDGQAFIDEWTADTNGWSGRDNAQPVFFLQVAYTLNEKLRREYHLN